MASERLPGQESARRSYFVMDVVAEAIDLAFVRKVAEAQKAVVAHYLPPENVQRFRHGETWQNPGAENSTETGMQTHSAVHEVAFEEVVSHNLGMISKALATIIEQMHRQFAEMFYSTIEQGAEAVGNTVNCAGLTPEEIFYRGLETVEVSANSDGSIRWPEFRGGGDMTARVKASLESAGPEFKERLNALMARKAEDARAREVARQARFLRYRP